MLCFNRRSLLRLLTTFMVVVVAAAQSRAVIEVKTSPDVDEQLFLTYVLDDIYSSWPTDVSNQQALQQQMADLRMRANRYYEYVKARQFDPKLVALFADCKTAVDEYIKFLNDIGRIEREAVLRFEAERKETAVSAASEGGSAALGAYAGGATNGEAAFTALLVGGLNWLIDDSAKSKGRDEAKLAAYEEARTELDSKLVSTFARIEISENELAIALVLQ